MKEMLCDVKQKCCIIYHQNSIATNLLNRTVSKENNCLLKNILPCRIEWLKNGPGCLYKESKIQIKKPVLVI